MRLYNSNKVNISKYIEEGRVTLFLFNGVSNCLECYEEANIFANNSHSYCYKVFTIRRFNRLIHRGYAVPK